MKSQFPDQGESWKMWFSGEDRLRKGPKEMEEQKRAEQQWNKIRRERINILKEAPSEENLWQAVMAFQDYPFKTVTGLPFQYTLKTGKNGEWTKELWIDRREKSKRFFPHLVEIDVLKLYNTFKIYLPRGIFIWTNLLSYLTQPMN